MRFVIGEGGENEDGGGSVKPVRPIVPWPPAPREARAEFPEERIGRLGEN